MMLWIAYGSASGGACPPTGLAAWPARLASMTHLSADPRAFVYGAATLCLIPNQKGTPARS